jgi:hypothetical protein
MVCLLDSEKQAEEMWRGGPSRLPPLKLCGDTVCMATVAQGGRQLQWVGNGARKAREGAVRQPCRCGRGAALVRFCVSLTCSRRACMCSGEICKLLR